MNATTTSSQTVQAIVLCAEWCGVCRDFAPAYAALRQELPEVAFHWVDVEDQADLVDALDVENFPTLLLGVNGEPAFFGTILPHAGTVARLAQQAGQQPSLSVDAPLPTLRRVLAALSAQPR